MTESELQAIEARKYNVVFQSNRLPKDVQDIDALVAEIRRLRAESCAVADAVAAERAAATEIIDTLSLYAALAKCFCREEGFECTRCKVLREVDQWRQSS